MIKADNIKKKDKEMPTVHEEAHAAYSEDSSPESHEDVGDRNYLVILFSNLWR